MHETDKKVYRPDIDGLRAIAVSLVVLFHFGVQALPGGFVGVDIFFVISGVLITSILVREMEQGRFSFLQFYRRRFRRIFPALCVVLLASLGLAGLLMMSQERIAVAWSAIYATASLANVYFWRHLGYFDGGAEETPLLHTWSLAVEEQYYIVFPAFLFLVFRYWRRGLHGTLAALIVLSLVASVVLTQLKPTAAFYLPMARTYELGLGAALALLPRASLRPAAAAALCLAGLLLCLLPALVLSTNAAFPGALALLPCMGAALIIYCGAVPNLVSRGLSSAPLVGLGKISYSVYLWHWPLLVFYKYYVMRPLQVGETLLLLCATLAMATLSYRFVETPFRRTPDASAGRWRELQWSVGMVGSVLAISWLLIANHGLPDAKDAAIMKSIHEGIDAHTASPCFRNIGEGAAPLAAASVCQLHQADSARAPRVLLWGDSYAHHYASAIKADRAFDGLDVFYQTHVGCAPFLWEGGSSCASFNRSVLEFIKTQHIDTVIVSANWWSYSREITFFQEIEQLTAKLAQRGLAVVLIGASPVYHSRVPHIAYRKWKFGNDTGGEGDAYEIEFDGRLDAGMEAAARAHAVYFSPYRQLCDRNVCRFRDEQGLFHIDQGHLSLHGAQFIIGRLLAENPRLLEARDPK